MSALLDEVINHAKQVRLSYEQYRKNTKYPKNLMGLCAKASYALFDRLKHYNIPCLFCGNSGHAFVVVNDHIIDITATQFGIKDKVFVKPITEVTEPFWKLEYTFKTYPEIYDYFVNSSWPNNQRPNI